MKQYYKWRGVKSKLAHVLLTLAFVVMGRGFVAAQTADLPPDFPVNDNTLVDPDAADFSSDIFGEDFGTDGTNDATDTTATGTTTETEATVITEATPATTTVTDTTSGPKENAIFWISFLGAVLVLQTTKQLLKDKQQNDVF